MAGGGVRLQERKYRNLILCEFKFALLVDITVSYFQCTVLESIDIESTHAIIIHVFHILHKDNSKDYEALAVCLSVCTLHKHSSIRSTGIEHCSKGT